MIAHRSQLFRLGVLFVPRFEDGFCRPDPDVSICSSFQNLFHLIDIGKFQHFLTSGSSNESISVGGNMAAVHFEILLFACNFENKISLMPQQLALSANGIEE